MCTKMKSFMVLLLGTMITGSIASLSRTAFSVTGKLRCRGFDDRFPEGKAKRAHQCVHDCFVRPPPKRYDALSLARARTLFLAHFIWASLALRCCRHLSVSWALQQTRLIDNTFFLNALLFFFTILYPLVDCK